MECYSILQYWEKKEAKRKEPLIKSNVRNSPLVLLMMQAGFKAQLHWLNLYTTVEPSS